MALWIGGVRQYERYVGRAGECAVSYVYDGDTVALKCGMREETARVQGLDTPETKEPRCPQEFKAGKQATLRLRALVKQGEVSYRAVGYDKYGRRLIRLSVDGEDVADTLVREGLAVAYTGGKRIDWCAGLKARG